MNSVLITGGAGFIGVNTAKYFAQKKWKVFIFDNLSRKGASRNIDYLKNNLDPSQIEVVIGDIRDHDDKLATLVEKVDLVIHLAAQVAVTWSVKNPRHDFEVNALGTLNVLEAIRNSKRRPALIFSSTNKVYGCLEKFPLIKGETRYTFEDPDFAVNEDTPIDLHSPYGCSKGAGDLYIIDYARLYGLKTVVFRQSCIYGQNQLGVEDQGWVAWFIIANILNKPITIFGDGKQVRDLLHVDDLSRLYLEAFMNIDKITGEAFNIGGGKDNSLSLLEFKDILEEKLAKKIECKYDDYRPGDQKIFIADTSKIYSRIGWKPQIGLEKGITGLIEWVKHNKEEIEKVLHNEH